MTELSRKTKILTKFLHCDENEIIHRQDTDFIHKDNVYSVLNCDEMEPLFPEILRGKQNESGVLKKYIKRNGKIERIEKMYITQYDAFFERDEIKYYIFVYRKPGFFAKLLKGVYAYIISCLFQKRSNK